MTAIEWRHRPAPVTTPVVPRERVYGEAVEHPELRSRPMVIIHEVASEHHVDVEAMIKHRSRHTDAYRLGAARSEAARRLDAIGLSTTQIGRFLHRDHTTILDYLGRRAR